MGDLLCLRQEQPRISQVQPQHFPRVCAQAKSEVGILGDLGLSKQALQFGLAGMYTHDVVSGVCDRDFSLRTCKFLLDPLVDRSVDEASQSVMVLSSVLTLALLCTCACGLRE